MCTIVCHLSLEKAVTNPKSHDMEDVCFFEHP